MKSSKTPQNYSIECIARAYIHFEILGDFDVNKPDPYELIQEFAFKHNCETLEVTYNSGGAAWSPYLILEGFDLVSVERVAKEIVRYIKRFKGHKFFTC